MDDYCYDIRSSSISWTRLFTKFFLQLLC